MDSCFSKRREILNRKGIKLFLAINIILIVMAVVIIIIGALASSEVSIIDTDHIKPLMDTITVDAIQPLGAVKCSIELFLVAGVWIFMYTWIIVLFVCKVGRIRQLILVMNTILLVTAILCEIAVIVQLVKSKDKVENEIKSKMILALEHFKADATTNSNSISNAWNFLFMSLDCCGVNPVASTTNDFDATTWCTTSGSCQATSSQIPKTCCLNVDENTYSSAPSGCHASVNSGTYNTKGCFDALKETLLNYYSSIIAVACITLIPEIIALAICGNLLKSNYNEVNLKG